MRNAEACRCRRSRHYVDVISDPKARRGSCGSGNIHHIAYRVGTDEEELEMQARLSDTGRGRRDQ